MLRTKNDSDIRRSISLIIFYGIFILLLPKVIYFIICKTEGDNDKC